ncbi:MAG: HIRAN domain-containing protein [Geodermatophilaceae bacterium]
MSTELRDQMTAERMDADFAAEPSSARTLFVIWQEPESRAFVKVGQLDQFRDGRYSFRYLPRAKVESNFHPLAEFPGLDDHHESRNLPAFFANRVMNRQRSDYREYRSWLGLDAEGADTPFEVLARTGGPRETDTFHVVDDVQANSAGQLVSRFFVSGVRHQPGSEALIKGLKAGARLALRDEPDNPRNPRAMLIDVVAGHAVGWVPDWLVDDVHTLRARDPELEVVVERCNPDAPAHLRLLCRISAQAG